MTIYSGASILGGNTVIGKGSIVGGNAFITESIPPFSRVSMNGNVASAGKAGVSIEKCDTTCESCDSEDCWVGAVTDWEQKK